MSVFQLRFPANWKTIFGSGAMWRMAIAALFFSMGCTTNPYEKNFVASGPSRGRRKPVSTASVILKTAIRKDDILQLVEDGYIKVGSSSFYGAYSPMAQAVDTARKHGASLVLLDIRYSGTEEYTDIQIIPTHSTTYDYGTMHSTAYGPRGMTYGTGSYSGTSTTTSYNSVSVKRQMTCYDHKAIFFQKVDLSSTYGIYWDIPQRLPTESPDAPIVVRVAAVLHGTPAERAGIQRGQIVKSINGIPIRSRRDIEPFVTDETSIKVVEVENAR